MKPTKQTLTILSALLEDNTNKWESLQLWKTIPDADETLSAKRTIWSQSNDAVTMVMRTLGLALSYEGKPQLTDRIATVAAAKALVEGSK